MDFNQLQQVAKRVAEFLENQVFSKSPFATNFALHFFRVFRPVIFFLNTPYGRTLLGCFILFWFLTHLESLVLALQHLRSIEEEREFFQIRRTFLSFVFVVYLVAFLEFLVFSLTFCPSVKKEIIEKVGEDVLKEAQSGLPFRFQVIPQLLFPLPLIFLSFLFALAGFYYVQYMKTFVEMVLAINQSKLIRSIREYGELYWSDAFFPDEMISKNGESHLSENRESHVSENRESHLSKDDARLFAPVIGVAVATAETIAPALVQLVGIVGATTAITTIADSSSKVMISYMETSADLAKENAENEILRIKLDHQHQEHQRDAELRTIQKVNDNAGSTSQEALKTIASTHDAPVAPASPFEELVIANLRADLDDRAANRDVDVTGKWVGVGRDAFSLSKDVVGSLDAFKELWIFGSS
jgi:hypothetical protein